MTLTKGTLFFSLCWYPGVCVIEVRCIVYCLHFSLRPRSLKSLSSSLKEEEKGLSFIEKYICTIRWDSQQYLYLHSRVLCVMTRKNVPLNGSSRLCLMKFLQKLTQLHLWLKLFSVLWKQTQTAVSTSILPSSACSYLVILTVFLEEQAAKPASCRNICNCCKLCWTVFHVGEEAEAGTDCLIGHHQFYRSDVRWCDLLQYWHISKKFRYVPLDMIKFFHIFYP